MHLLHSARARTGFDKAYRPFPVDQDRGREGRCPVLNLCLLVAGYDKIIRQAILFAKAFQELDLVRIIDVESFGTPIVTGDAEDDKAFVAVVTLPFGQVRKRIEARPAPRCPEIKKNNLAAERGKRLRLAGNQRSTPGSSNAGSAISL